MQYYITLITRVKTRLNKGNKVSLLSALDGIYELFLNLEKFNTVELYSDNKWTKHPQCKSLA